MREKAHILPTPKKVVKEGKFIEIGELCKVSVTIINKSDTIQAKRAKELIEKAFLEKTASLELSLGYPITLTVGDDSISEYYEIKISEEGTELFARGIKGIFHAATVFSGLIRVCDTKVYLPVSSIYDEPTFKTRGVYLESRYNDFLSLEDWKDAVDYFAEKRFNTIFIAVYNCWSLQYDGVISEFLHVPFKDRPEIKVEHPIKYYSVKKEGWVVKPPRRSKMAEEDFLGEIIRYAKERGITVTTLFAPFGHNTLLPRVHPEISAKEEDGTPKGLGICSESQETVDFMISLYDEIIDKYLEPNGIDSFFIGMDEVDFNSPSKRLDENGRVCNKFSRCMCPLCKDKSDFDLYTDYLIKLLKALKKRGMKNVYVYFDMFFFIFDRIDEELVKRFKDEGVYDITVFVWWNYGANLMFFRQKADKVNNLFRSIGMPMSGYTNWEPYGDNTENIAEMAAKCLEQGFEGLVSYTTYAQIFDYNHLYLAEAGWDPSLDFLPHRDAFAKKYFDNHYPECADEAFAAWNLAQPRFSFYDFADKQIAGASYGQYQTSYALLDAPYPRDHFVENIKKIEENEERHFKYFDDLFYRVDTALSFFESDKVAPSRINSIMILNLYTLRNMVDWVKSIYLLVKRSRADEIKKDEIERELKRLINECRKLILMTENVRIEPLTYHPLRIVSITLEYLNEMLDGVRSGRLTTLEPEKFVDRASVIFKFLR